MLTERALSQLITGKKKPIAQYSSNSLRLRVLHQAVILIGILGCIFSRPLLYAYLHNVT